MKNIIKKILKLLTRRERKRLYLLFVAMTISALIEVAGIASIIPFLSLITDPTIIERNSILNWLYTVLGFQNYDNFLIFSGIVVLLFLIISNLVILFTMWGTTRFINLRNFTISKRLLSKYLYQPYVFFLNKNTTELGKNILTEVEKFTIGIMMPSMRLVSRGVVALFIFTLLIIAEPLLSLVVVVVLGGVYILIYRIIKRRLSNIGKRYYKSNTERFKSVNEAFGSIKPLKLGGSEDFFIKNYSKPAYNRARNDATYQVVSEIPRYIIEIIAIGGMVSVVLYLLASGREFQSTLPTIGLFAFAAYRIMPALQSVFVSITTIRFYIPTLEGLCNDMYSFRNETKTKYNVKEKISSLRMQKELKLKRITFYYPGTSTPVVDNLDLTININTSVAFIGKTGAGKTTIADIILGLLRPNSGSILVDGIKINEDNLHGWQKNLGYIPQNIYLQDDSVARNIAFGISDDKINMNMVKSAAKIANIHDFVQKELSNSYQTIVGENGVRLSGGQRQRIGIARALYHDPMMLVLDEATSALDGSTEKEVFEAIDNISETKTLIIIAHRLTTIKRCDVIYILKDGKIVGQGKYEELMKSNKEFKNMAMAHL